jgi:hypothetical protein
MFSRHFVSASLVVLLAVGCGLTGAAWKPPSAVEARAEIALGDEFTLSIGQTASIGDETGLQVTFEAVLEDSRCPSGVSCVWAGDAVVSIAAVDSTGRTTRLELHTNTSFDAAAPVDDLSVHLVGLAPTPSAQSQSEVDKYLASLVVRRQPA